MCTVLCMYYLCMFELSMFYQYKYLPRAENHITRHHYHYIKRLTQNLLYLMLNKIKLLSHVHTINLETIDQTNIFECKTTMLHTCFNSKLVKSPYVPRVFLWFMVCTMSQYGPHVMYSLQLHCNVDALWRDSSTSMSI